MTRKRIGWILMVVFVITGKAWARVDPPVIVSPGNSERIEIIEQRCPTFSWGIVQGAQAYELLVFRAPATARVRAGAEQRLATSTPLLRVRIAASAGSWTPSSDQCLESGRTYAWYLREVGTYSPFVGDWSDGKLFRVAAARDSNATPDDDGDGRGPGGASGVGGRGGFPDQGQGNGPPGFGGAPGNGTGGIPAVLAELAAINHRLDAIEERIADIDHDLYVHSEDVMPCTPDRWRAGKCNILEVQATVCFNVSLGAELGAKFSVEPGLHFGLGAGWDLVPIAEYSGTLDVPYVGTLGVIPIPFVLPDVAAGLQIGADGGVRVCIADLTVPLGDKDKAGSVEEFTDKLVTAFETQAGAITRQISEVLDERGLDGSRIADTVARLRDFQGGGLETNDPMEILQSGKLRDFIDTLPVDGEFMALLDNPSPLMPQSKAGRLPQVCESLPGNMLQGNAQQICDFVETQPDLIDLAERIRNMPAVVADEVCKLFGADSCAEIGDKVTCRQTCRSKNSACKDACGNFNPGCKRACDADKNVCIGCCNNATDPNCCHDPDISCTEGN